MKSLVLLILAATAFGQTPIDYQKWRTGQDQYRQQIGGAIQNYRTGEGWAAINNRWTLEGDSVVTCNTAALKTRINKQGLSTVTLNHNGTDYTVTQRLLGIGWINTATHGSLWIDSAMTWNTPTVGDSTIIWTGVSPGIDYRIDKLNGQVPHRISFKPAFLDSAVTLYNQRSDSLDIALANVMVYTISANCDDHDVAIGDVRQRVLKQLGPWTFQVESLYLTYPGWAMFPQISVRQYWERRGSNLICLEYVMMSALKQIHEALPAATIWHNASSSLGSGTNDADDSQLHKLNTTTNYGSNVQVYAFDDNTSTGRIRPIFKWDTLRTILYNQTVSACTLTLTPASQITDPLTFTVHGLIRYWEESEVHWDSATSSVAWATAGADGSGTDRTSSSYGSFTNADTAADGSYPVDLTSLAQTWDETDTANAQGIMLTASNSNWDQADFVSAEWAVDSSQRPKIVVYYSSMGGDTPTRRRRLILGGR